MLNEIQEYKEYSMPLEELNGDGRLMYMNLKENFRGLERAMIMIARHFLFLPDGNRGTEPDVRLAQKALAVWCGFSEESFAEGSELQKLSGWLPRYINYLNSREGRTKGVADIAAKKAMFPRHLFSEKLSEFEAGVRGANGKKGHDINRITYQRIIADALILGPLTRYYLVCESEVLLRRWSVRKDGNPVRLDGANGQKNFDLLLRLTACYLLGKRGQSRQYVEFKQADVANWRNCGKKDFIADAIKSLRFAEQPVGPFRAIAEKRVVRKPLYKLKLDESWVEQFFLVEESKLDEALQEKPERIFYSDPGAGVLLQKGIRYS